MTDHWHHTAYRRQGLRHTPDWTEGPPPASRVRVRASELLDGALPRGVVDLVGEGVYVTVPRVVGRDAAGRSDVQVDVSWNAPPNAPARADLACAHVFGLATGTEPVVVTSHEAAQLWLHYAAAALEVLHAITRAVRTPEGTRPPAPLRVRPSPDDFADLSLALRVAMLLEHDERELAVAVVTELARTTQRWQRRGVVVLALDGTAQLGEADRYRIAAARLAAGGTSLATVAQRARRRAEQEGIHIFDALERHGS